MYQVHLSVSGDFHLYKGHIPGCEKKNVMTTPLSIVISKHRRGNKSVHWYSPAAIILHLLSNNESMSEG